MYIPVSILIAIAILYSSYEIDKKGKKKDDIERNTKRKYINNNEIDNINNLNNYDINSQKKTLSKSEKIKEEIIIVDNKKKPISSNSHDLNKNNIENEYMLIDNDNLIKDTKLIEGMNNTNNDNILKRDETNPFMNINSYKFINNTPELNFIDSQNEIDKNFEHNLFLDFEDAYRNRNSQRQFYSIPGNGLPNDQMKFAKWLYNDDTNCKLNTKDCLPPPRYKRIRIGNQL